MSSRGIPEGCGLANCKIGSQEYLPHIPTLSYSGGPSSGDAAGLGAPGKGEYLRSHGLSTCWSPRCFPRKHMASDKSQDTDPPSTAQKQSGTVRSSPCAGSELTWVCVGGHPCVLRFTAPHLNLDKQARRPQQGPLPNPHIQFPVLWDIGGGPGAPPWGAPAMWVLHPLRPVSSQPGDMNTQE